MKVLILVPFLDAPFKKERGTARSGQIEPIRLHWVNFVKNLAYFLQHNGHGVRIWEDYMWKFTPENTAVKDDDYDLIYVPHKCKHNFETDLKSVRFYMQTVVPQFFTVDTEGWGGSNSRYPFMDQTTPAYIDYWSVMKKRIRNNESKFDQPPPSAQFNDFVDQSDEGCWLFPCQLPHDETIKYHSDVSVVDACIQSIRAAEAHRKRLIVKSHPVNPSSMQPIREAVLNAQQNGANVAWVENVSIHDCLSAAEVVLTVNSGVGFEALLHEKHVVTFGQAEYDCVTQRIDDLSFLAGPVPVEKYRSFVNNFLWNFCVDGSDLSTYDINKIT